MECLKQIKSNIITMKETNKQKKIIQEPKEIKEQVVNKNSRDKKVKSPKK